MLSITAASFSVHYRSWNFSFLVRESLGKVREFDIWLRVGTLYSNETVKCLWSDSQIRSGGVVYVLIETADAAITASVRCSSFLRLNFFGTEVPGLLITLLSGFIFFSPKFPGLEIVCFKIPWLLQGHGRKNFIWSCGLGWCFSSSTHH